MEREFCPYCMTPVKPGEACPQCGLTAGSYTPEPHHLPLGATLKEQYLVGRVLGEGGFGITYIGYDLKLEMKVAIKEYFPKERVNRVSQASLSVASYSSMADKSYETGKLRFLQEARTMAKMVKQPVIVSVRDFFEENNTAYIVMEFIEGITFKELVVQKGGRIPAGELLHQIEPLFFALSAMHEIGLIHRDISPDNLMLERGAVRLLDFGCAREAENGERSLSIILKHGYAPMEQYMNKGQGPWTDVYALSATIYYCLTGQKPPQSMDRLSEDELILPRRLGVDLTEQQERALLYGMGIRPRRRFQSVRELHAALYEGAPVVGLDAAEEERIRQAEIERQAQEEERRRQEAELRQRQEEERQRQEAEARQQQAEETSAQAGDAPTGLAGWLRRNRLLVAGCAAALALIVILAAVLPRLTGGEDPPDASGTPGPSIGDEQPPVGDDPQDPDPEELFAGASNAYDLSSLRTLLADDSVKAVVIPTGAGFRMTGEELAIAKPLLIDEGVWIEGLTNITVSGGGHLRVEGDLSTVGIVRTADGGTISVGSAGGLHSSLFWTERAGDLTVDPGGMAEAAGQLPESGGFRYLVFSEEEVFANARHVSSYDELLEALDGGQPVVIDADMAMERVTHDVPVLISEGVTVTVSNTWDVDGTVLVNRGALRGHVSTGDWDSREDENAAVLNYGTMDIGFYAGGYWGDQGQYAAVWLNLGEMTTWNGQFRSGGVYNLGTLYHRGNADGSYFDLAGAVFLNSGELVVGPGGDNPYGESHINTTMGASFSNLGSIRLEDGGRIDNQTYLLNLGSLVIGQGGFLNNRGLIENYGDAASLVDEWGGLTDEHGAIQYDPAYPLRLAEGASYSEQRLVPFVWGASLNMGHIWSEDELPLRLKSAWPATIMVDTPMTLTQDITVTKGMVIAGGRLTVDGGSITVEGEDAFLILDHCDLGGSTLTLRDGATAIVSGLENCGGLDISNSSTLLVKGDLSVYGEDVNVQDAMLVNLNWLYLEDCDLTLNGGLYSTGWRMELINSEVTVGEHGWLHSEGDLRVDGGALENYGRSSVFGWEWQERYLGGVIHNWANMDLHNNVEFYCEMVNHGTIHLHQGDEDGTLYVRGSLDNRGRIAMAEDFMRVRAIDGGSFTGDQAEYDPNFYNY